jgi:RES domain-containing protein
LSEPNWLAAHRSRGEDERQEAKERAALTPKPLAGHLFRVTSPNYRDLAKTAKMSKRYPQRFNTSQLGAVYASREPNTAGAEALRRYSRDAKDLDRVHPRTVFVLSVRLQRVITLTTEEGRQAWGITKADLSGDDFTRCQEVATIAAGRGVEMLRWPSATGSGESIALFWDCQQPGTQIDIIAEYVLKREWLDALAHGAPLTEFVPQLENYQLYEP